MVKIDKKMVERINEVLGDANQAKIAEELGVTPQAITKWKKNGKISKNNAIGLAKVRGYNPEWLISGEGAKFTKKSNVTYAVRINHEIIAECIKEFEDGLKAHKVSWNSIKTDDFARAITLLYEEHAEKGETNTQTVDNVIRFCRLG